MNKPLVSCMLRILSTCLNVEHLSGPMDRGVLNILLCGLPVGLAIAY